MEKIGRYEILRPVGDRGGMAEVFLAWEPERERDVALKRVDFRSSDPQVAARFLRESRLAERLDHPNIVAVYDLFEHAGVPYIAMEYLETGSLRSRVRALTPPQIMGVIEGVLAGLSHAHLAGVVHRDLKPENLLIGDDGVIKIADFGIAKAFRDEETRLTGAGMTVGTPTYMAPEQAHGQPVTPATDLYALGAIVYEMVSGKPPFADTDAPMSLIFRKVNENPPSLGIVAPDIDARLAHWADRLLMKTPDLRPQSAGEAWHALDEIVSELYGPNWRRSARLTDANEHPLPHARFDVPDDAGYKTFVAPMQHVPIDDDEEELSVAVRSQASTAPPPPPPPPPRQAAPAFQQDSWEQARPPTYYGSGPSRRTGLVVALMVVAAVLALVIVLVVSVLAG